MRIYTYILNGCGLSVKCVMTGSGFNRQVEN
jgi:hypothetical protein